MEGERIREEDGAMARHTEKQIIGRSKGSVMRLTKIFEVISKIRRRRSIFEYGIQHAEDTRVSSLTDSEPFKFMTGIGNMVVLTQTENKSNTVIKERSSLPKYSQEVEL